MNTLLNGLMLGLVIMLSGCAQRLADIHSSEPRQTATFLAPYQALVACTKEQVQLEDWVVSIPAFQTIEGTTTQNTRIYAYVNHWVWFDVTFRPANPSGTLVEYRDQWTADHIHKHAWSVIERCASQLSAASARPTAAIP